MVWVVVGPTSGGKTELAVSMARRFGWPILTLDSMKVYRRMDIGTAKPGDALRDELHFELIDLREPWESFSVADYLEEWRLVSARIEGPRIIAGGTAFYLNALLEGLFEGPGPDPVVRQRLDQEAERSGTATLHGRLREVDPVAAAKIHRTDLRRIVRALEVFETSGEPISVWHARRTPFLDRTRTALIGVARPREELHARIDARVERMFATGWVEEVEALVEAHDPPWSERAAQSIGYECIRAALAGKRDPREEIPTICHRTHAFARRQITWVRKMPVEWWRIEERDELLERVERITRGSEPFAPDEERKGRWSKI